MKALHHIAATLLSFLMMSFPAYGQKKLTGWVIDKKSEKKLTRVHVINKSTLDGTTTDKNGYFEQSLEFGDTIVFSNVAYKYFYFVYNDTATDLKNVVIKMEEQNYLLKEASVTNYKLTTNEPQEIVLQEPSTPGNDELEDQKVIKAGVQNPAEFLYNLFGSKPEELRKLAKVKAEDAYRRKLKESNNRKAVMQLTGLSKKELEAFMFYCKFTRVRMRTLNDYQFLRSVQRCYQEYVDERELENFLQQFD